MEYVTETKEDRLRAEIAEMRSRNEKIKSLFSQIEADAVAIAEQADAEISALRQKVIIGRGALELARKLFLFHVDHHMDKTPPDIGKVRVNQKAAGACLAAINLMADQSAGDE